MGKSASVVVGYTYFGSYAMAICLGPVDILHAIYNGDTLVWEGPILRSEAMDVDGMTDLTTELGNIRFYWGTDTQNQDAILAAVQLDTGQGTAAVTVPNWPGLCYAVMNDIAFGQQTVPPQLYFVVSKFPDALGLNAADAITAVRVTNAGEGYNAAPTVSFGGPGAGAAATAIVKDGKVIGFELTNGGSGYATLPTVTLTPTSGGTGATAKATTFAEVEGDSHIPEVLYEALRSRFGLGLASGLIDSSSWATVGETLLDEDVTVSCWQDDYRSARDLIGAVLEYCDGVITREAGKLKLKLMRKEDPSGAPLIDETALTDEPQIDNSQFGETYNVAQVAFMDRDNSWEQSIEVYEDGANTDMLGGEIRTEQFDRPFVTRRSVAKTLAKQYGIKGGVPSVEYRLRLLPQYRTLKPGDLIRLSWAARGIVEEALRVMEVTLGEEQERIVSVLAVTDWTRDTSNDYVIPDDYFEVGGFVDKDGKDEFAITSQQPRCLTLPEDLRNIPGSGDDGVFVCIRRDDPSVNAGQVFVTWNPAIQEYENKGVLQTFPIQAEVIGWQRAGVETNHWLIRLRVTESIDIDALTGYLTPGTEYAFVSDGQTVRAKRGVTFSAGCRLDGVWSFLKSGHYTGTPYPGVFDFEVYQETGSDWNEERMALELSATAMRGPSSVMAVATRKKLPAVQFSDFAFRENVGNTPLSGVGTPDADWKRYVKVPVKNIKTVQTVDDATACYLDRNDTTEGEVTYSPNWGGRALVLAERLDYLAGIVMAGGGATTDYLAVQDLDVGLGKVLDGNETTAEEFVTLHTDADLLAQWDVGYYNGTRL